MQLLICCRGRWARALGGGARSPHPNGNSPISGVTCSGKKRGELHSSDRDISFTKHFLLCTWKHGIITRGGDAPWNGMGAQIRGSGHSAVSTEMRVILYPEMPVSVGKDPAGPGHTGSFIIPVHVKLWFFFFLCLIDVGMFTVCRKTKLTTYLLFLHDPCGIPISLETS